MSDLTTDSAETLAEAERTVAEAICRSIIDGNVLGGTHTVWTDWRPEAKAAIQALIASDWMKRHDAEVRAEAWDEGERAGRDNADDGYPDPLVENPYRAALAEEGGR